MATVHSEGRLDFYSPCSRDDPLWYIESALACAVQPQGVLESGSPDSHSGGSRQSRYYVPLRRRLRSAQRISQLRVHSYPSLRARPSGLVYDAICHGRPPVGPQIVGRIQDVGNGTYVDETPAWRNFDPNSHSQRRESQFFLASFICGRNPS